MTRWAPIKGFEKFYEISTDGIVRRKAGAFVRFPQAKIVAQQLSNSGYVRVRLCGVGKHGGQKFSVHRLVYESFIGPIPNGQTPNHINGIKTDNRLQNLELATKSEQMIHAYATGLQKRQFGEQRGRVARLTTDEVLKIRQLFSEKIASVQSIAAAFGMSTSTIYKIAQGHRWSHL